MRAHLAYIRTTLRLVMRDRVVLFFNYFLPLLFFIVFAQSFGADKGGAVSQVTTMVFIFGVLGSGFFGAGLRAVQEREQNILRRFKVAPITALPILVSSLVTGLIAYLPSVFLILGIGRFYYGMPWPERWISLLLMLSFGLLAFRSIGLIIGAVVNSMQESQIIIQLLYLPMLFLSGATFPVSMMPDWLQIVAQFLPASYLYTGLQGILVRKDSILDNLTSVAAMAVTVAVATLLGVKLFRWEKDERMPAKAKLWLAAVMLPFLLLGVYQSYSRDNVSKAKLLFREMRRNRTLLIRGPRVFVGDGRMIAAGGVLIRNGRIEQVYETVPPESDRTEVLEAAGKTLLPGLNDAHVHLLAPGGILESWDNYEPGNAAARALGAYLYSGVTAVKSVGDAESIVLAAQQAMARGDRLGAALVSSGKMFTTEGGHGTEYFKSLPDNIRETAQRDTLFLPNSPAEARRQVDQLHASGVRAVKAILDAGNGGALFNRMDTAILAAICEQAKKHGMPVSVHTGDARDVADAITAGAATIEHGSARDAIPDALFAEMARRGIAYDPALSVIEAVEQLRGGRFELLDRTLVQQVAPEGLTAATRRILTQRKFDDRGLRADMAVAADNLLRAHKARVRLITGTDSGNLLLIHGPALHRELQLWVRAGIPPAVVLTAATSGTAAVMALGPAVGYLRPGQEATMLLVDGDPLEDISATERISAVFFKGERVDRAGLFEQD